VQLPARTERHHSLYGDRRGNWVLLESATGIILPPALEACACEGGTAPPLFRVLRNFGSPRDLITVMYEQMPAVVHGDGRGAPIQRTMAGLLGVTQQSISRYLNGHSEPDLPDPGWRMLSHLAAAWTEWPGHPADLDLARRTIAARKLS